MSQHLSNCSLQCDCGELNAFTSRGEPPFVHSHICGACGAGWIVHIDSELHETWWHADKLVASAQRQQAILEWAKEQQHHMLAAIENLRMAGAYHEERIACGKSRLLECFITELEEAQP